MTTQLPALREPDPVALAPDAGEHLEVRAAVEGAVAVSPQLDRHRRHRPRDHELARARRRRGSPFGSKASAATPSRRPEISPSYTGSSMRAAHDPAADVGAAAAVDQQHVGPELLVDVAVALGRERRAGRAEDADRARDRDRARARAPPCGRPSGTAGLTPMNVGRVSSAIRHCQPRSGHAGSPSSITIDERTSERRDERVPHHPRRRAEPEQAAARLQIPAERVRLEVLEQDAAVPVDDRLRPAGRPGREEHEQRVVERDRQERRAAPARRAARPRTSASGTACSP